MKVLQAFLRAPRWEVAKYLSEEEGNEGLHFLISYHYCKSHTNSCKNYNKNPLLYNTKHYLIIIRVLGGNIYLRTLFSNNIIYGFYP